MILVIDFNGYLSSKNDFTIKEYSLYTMTALGNISKNEFDVVSPDIKDLNDLDSKSQKNYEIYYQKYGIKWTTGTIPKKAGITYMMYYIGKSERVFLADEEKINHFISYLNIQKTSKAKYVSLKSLGYKMNFANSTNCHYHQSPSSNNCANDNVLDMVTFIKDKKLYNSNMQANLYSVIDFNCFKFENHSLFKEVSINRISIDGVVTSHDLFVEKPLGMPQSGLSGYEEYYQRYGIRWKAGNETLRSIKCNLASNLKRSLRTYVKNKTQKNILLRLSSENIKNKIICLEELGYDVGNTELGFTTCKWHDNKTVNNCADDNVRLMTDWIFRNNILKLEISDDLKPNKSKENVKIPTIVVNKGVVYQDTNDTKARYYEAQGSQEFSSVANAAAASTSDVGKRKFDNSLMPSTSQYYNAFASMVSSSDLNKRHKIKNLDDNTGTISKSYDRSHAISSIGKVAATSTSTADKSKFEAFPSSDMGYGIKDDDNDDDDVFNMASELGIEIKDDNGPNMSQYYQVHGSNDFQINQTEEQTNYDDESAINTAFELESQMGKRTPKNIADLSRESLFKNPIDNLHNYSFSSNEFDGLLDDEDDNHRSKIDVNQRYDRTDEQFLSSSDFNNPNSLLDDDNELNDFSNIDALAHSEAKSDNGPEDNDDQENEIFDEQLLHTYIVKMPNDISFDEDEFNNILDEDEL